MMMKEIAPRIVVDEQVRFGKPVVKDTRVAVTTVLGHLAAGDTPEDIAEDYGITKDDVLACVAYAQHVLEQDQFRAVP